MEIQPYLGEQIIAASSVEVRVNPQDRERAKKLIKWCSNILEVTNDDTFQAARHGAGELKAMLDEIEISRKQAKTPFTAVGRTIDDVARTVGDPVLKEQKRVLALMAAYVAKLEAARREEFKRQEEAKRLAQEEVDRQIREARTSQEREQAELAKELSLDVEMLDNDERPRGLVPDGRVTHTYEFELVDIGAVIAAGCWRLMRWEIDVLACRDAVKNLVEMLPPDQEPTLPGIKITKKLNVSVKAATRIS